MHQNKIIQILTISSSEMRFDYNCNIHQHFLCNECGELIDIEVKCKFLDKMMQGEHYVQEVHGYFKGICNKCLKKGKKKKAA